ncbi:MAG TPA: TlpA disulfide reductase family protein, partial [Bacteroidia bacterium]|nr:TlpA disulfide reductase family protein [Bacteroidia bacterium]
PLSSIKAKYTVLIFWDVECGHCQTEMPKLVEVYHELKKKTDVQVVAVYTLQEFEKWRKYLISKKLDFINLYDPVYINNMKNKYDIFSTPKVFILDEKKTIIAKHMPVDKIPELIEIHEKKFKTN